MKRLNTRNKFRSNLWGMFFYRGQRFAMNMITGGIAWKGTGPSITLPTVFSLRNKIAGETEEDTLELLDWFIVNHCEYFERRIL